MLMYVGTGSCSLVNYHIDQAGKRRSVKVPSWLDSTLADVLQAKRAWRGVLDPS